MISDDEDPVPPTSMPLSTNSTGDMSRELDGVQGIVTKNTTVTLVKHGAASVLGDFNAANVKSYTEVADDQR